MSRLSKPIIHDITNDSTSDGFIRFIEEGANATQKESDAFQVRVADYRKAVAGQEKNEATYDY